MDIESAVIFGIQRNNVPRIKRMRTIDEAKDPPI